MNAIRRREDVAGLLRRLSSAVIHVLCVVLILIPLSQLSWLFPDPWVRL